MSIIQFDIFYVHFVGLGQYDKAAQILDSLDRVVPHNKLIILRRINLERRRHCYNRVCELFEYYVNTENSTPTSILFAVKYARFVWKVCK